MSEKVKKIFWWFMVVNGTYTVIYQIIRGVHNYPNFEANLIMALIIMFATAYFWARATDKL